MEAVMRLIGFCVTCASVAALTQAPAPNEACAGPLRAAAPQAVSLTSDAEPVSDKGYYERYYRRRYGFYRHGYDPSLSIPGADMATAPVTSLYGNHPAFPTPFAYGDPWPADEPYPFYDYPNASYGYGYGYPIYGGFRHRYYGPAVPEPGGVPETFRGYTENGEEHWPQGNDRPWGGGFTHRGFDGARYQTPTRARRSGASQR
jgi:hypothetical protein